MVKVPSQVVYQTNADYTATEEALTNNTLVVVAPTKKGLLWFRFVDNRTIFQLSPMGKLQVKWGDINEKKTLYKLVKNLIVANQNEKLVIKPLKQQTWIDYPVPESFKLYWCDETTEFTLKKPPNMKEQETPDKSKSSNRFANSKSNYEEMEEKRKSDFRAKLFKVRNSLEELRNEFRYLREPTLNEISLKSGCLDPSFIRIAVIGSYWKPQSLDNSIRLAEASMDVASWLQFQVKGELNPQLITLSQKAIDSAAMDVIERAQIILKNCPEMVPKVSTNELCWSDEAKIKWIKVFGAEPPVPQNWK